MSDEKLNDRSLETKAKSTAKAPLEQAKIKSFMNWGELEFIEGISQKIRND